MMPAVYEPVHIAQGSRRNGLEPYRLPVDVPLDLRYAPAVEAEAEGAGEDRDISADDADTSYYHDDMIDLNELLREQFYLALPMKPLCREECLGLCPQCGSDRNTNPCDCQPDWQDPRLAALAGAARLTTGRPATASGGQPPLLGSAPTFTCTNTSTACPRARARRSSSASSGRSPRRAASPRRGSPDAP